MTNIRSKLPIASDMCKNVSLALLFGSQVIQIQSLCIQICIYIYIYIYIYTRVYTYVSQYREAARAQKNLDSSECPMPRKFSACHFVHACHRFASPALHRTRWNAKGWNIAHIFSYLQPIQRSLCSWYFRLSLSNQTEVDASNKTTGIKADTTGKTQGLVWKPSVYVQGPILTSIEMSIAV